MGKNMIYECNATLSPDDDSNTRTIPILRHTPPPLQFVMQFRGFRFFIFRDRLQAGSLGPYSNNVPILQNSLLKYGYSTAKRHNSRKRHKTAKRYKQFR